MTCPNYSNKLDLGQPPPAPSLKEDYLQWPLQSIHLLSTGKSPWLTVVTGCEQRSPWWPRESGTRQPQQWLGAVDCAQLRKCVCVKRGVVHRPGDQVSTSSAFTKSRCLYLLGGKSESVQMASWLPSVQLIKLLRLTSLPNTLSILRKCGCQTSAGKNPCSGYPCCANFLSRTHSPGTPSTTSKGISGKAVRWGARLWDQTDPVRGPGLSSFWLVTLCVSLNHSEFNLFSYKFWIRTRPTSTNCSEDYMR